MNLNKQNLINKIKYRSQYRGTKEMDIFVISFVKKVIPNMNFEELVQLNKLVNLSDEKFIEISNGDSSFDISDKILKLLIDFRKNN